MVELQKIRTLEILGPSWSPTSKEMGNLKTGEFSCQFSGEVNIKLRRLKKLLYVWLYGIGQKTRIYLDFLTIPQFVSLCTCQELLEDCHRATQIASNLSPQMTQVSLYSASTFESKTQWFRYGAALKYTWILAAQLRCIYAVHAAYALISHLIEIYIVVSMVQKARTSWDLKKKNWLIRGYLPHQLADPGFLKHQLGFLSHQSYETYTAHTYTTED